MRLLTLALVLLGTLRWAHAGDGPAGAVAPSPEESIAVLRVHLEQIRAGEGAKAASLFDSRAVAEAAFGTQLAAADEPQRRGLLDLFTLVWPHVFDTVPEWAEAGSAWPFDDFRAEALGEAGMAVTARWHDPHLEVPARWGLLLTRRDGRLVAVDALLSADYKRRASTVLRDELASFSKWHPDSTLSDFLRCYFRVPLPDTVVPASALADWASPDVLAMSVEVPFVRGAPLDGWTPPGMPRLVVHLEASGGLRWRPATGTTGTCMRPVEGSLATPESARSALSALTSELPKGVIVLLRADRRTPWSAVRAVVHELLEAGVTSISFGVLRGRESNAGFGQVGLWPGSICHVHPTALAASAADGMQMPSPGPPPRRDPFPVRLRRTLGTDRRAYTSIEVGDEAPQRLDAQDPTDPEATWTRLEGSVRARRAAQGAVRVRLEIPSPDGDLVPFGDVVPLLFRLQKTAGAPVDLADFPFPDESSRLPDPPELEWRVPAGWTVQPARLFFLVRLAPDGSQGTECSLSAYPRTAGHALAVINRWRRLLGLDDLMEDELSSLPRVTVLAVSAPMMTAVGTLHPKGEKAIEDAMIVCTVAELPDYTVHVKLSGPRAEVEPQRKAFQEFCASLREK